MKLQEDIYEQSLLNPELINYLPFLYSHQFVLFVCFFQMASPFIFPSLQQMDAGLNFHLALVVLSSWAFECYLAYCQRDSGKTKARNAIWQIHTFIGCSLEEECWECRESYDAEAWLLCWMVKSEPSHLCWDEDETIAQLLIILPLFFTPCRTKPY